MSDTIIELQNVTVLRHTEATGLFGLWGAKPVRALESVSLSVRRGETVGVVGGSGSGKTTLAETVALRRPPDRGRVLFQGVDAAKLRGDDRRRAHRRLPMIRQDPRESLEMDRTVRRQLTDLLRSVGLPDPDGRITRALQQVELPPGFAERRPVEMSGGQQQRVAIARSLALNPLLIAADEPVSGVDPLLQQELIGLLQRVQREQGVALLLVSQDLRLIRRLAHRVAVLHAGRLFEAGPAAAVLGEPRHPYSRLFLGHDPGLMPPEEDLAGRTFAGCPWAAHCHLVSDPCLTEAPVLREVSPGHTAACHALPPATQQGG